MPFHAPKALSPLAGQALVFPSELVVGHVVLEDDVWLHVVGRSPATGSGKTTRAWVQHEGEAVQRKATREDLPQDAGGLGSGPRDAGRGRDPSVGTYVIDR